MYWTVIIAANFCSSFVGPGAPSGGGVGGANAGPGAGGSSDSCTLSKCEATFTWTQGYWTNKKVQESKWYCHEGSPVLNKVQMEDNGTSSNSSSLLGLGLETPIEVSKTIPGGKSIFASKASDCDLSNTFFDSALKQCVHCDKSCAGGCVGATPLDCKACAFPLSGAALHPMVAASNATNASSTTDGLACAQSKAQASIAAQLAGKSAAEQEKMVGVNMKLLRQNILTATMKRGFCRGYLSGGELKGFWEHGGTGDADIFIRMGFLICTLDWFWISRKNALFPRKIPRTSILLYIRIRR